MTPPTSRVDTPQDVPHTCWTLVPSLERDVERFGKILTEVMRRARLQRAAVAHQRLNRIGSQRARELLALALLPLHDGHAKDVLGHAGIDVQNHERLGLGFIVGFVGRVAFLPEELGRPQEGARDLLPPHDIGPLVDQDGQIAPRLDPLRIHGADDRFRRRTHDERFFELFAAGTGHVRHLRREPLDVLRLFVQKALRNEQRKVGVDVPRALEFAIEGLLDLLPDRVTIGADDHAPFDRRIIRKLRTPHDVEIPL